MQFEPNRPIWLQVMEIIQTEIVTGARQPGDKLPGGRDLAIQYSINPNTAARVYQELEKEGLCETRRGMGTYISEDREKIACLQKKMADQAVGEFLERMKMLGISRKKAYEMLLEQEES